MNAGEYMLKAHLTCESCEYEAQDSGGGMMHAMTTGHTVSGETPEGDTVTISTEPTEE